jgi:hypothetical protein
MNCFYPTTFPRLISKINFKFSKTGNISIEMKIRLLNNFMHFLNAFRVTLASFAFRTFDEKIECDDASHGLKNATDLEFFYSDRSEVLFYIERILRQRKFFFRLNCWIHRWLSCKRCQKPFSAFIRKPFFDPRGPFLTSHLGETLTPRGEIIHWWSNSLYAPPFF